MADLWLTLQRHWWRRKTHHPHLRKLLSEPIKNRPFRETRYVVIDLETTALEPSKGEIASIAWVVIEQGTILLNQSCHYHVALENEVGQSAIFHQLTDTELQQGASVTVAIEALLPVLSNSVLVFHNARLDMGFLNKVTRTLWGTPLLMPIADTLQLERKKLIQHNKTIQAGDLRLFQCRKRYGLPECALHNALGDALATAELWLAMNNC